MSSRLLPHALLPQGRSATSLDGVGRKAVENRLKSSLGPPTQYEQQRIDAMVRLGCVACAHIGLPYSTVEVHHLLQGNKKMGHWFTIPLCGGHHQNVWSREQLQLIEPKMRVSIASGRKAFARYYPTERALWERVQKRLKLPAVWPESKRVPRGGNLDNNTMVDVRGPGIEHATSLRERALPGNVSCGHASLGHGDPGVGDPLASEAAVSAVGVLSGGRR
jgi:hypothetical protein